MLVSIVRNIQTAEHVQSRKISQFAADAVAKPYRLHERQTTSLMNSVQKIEVSVGSQSVICHEKRVQNQFLGLNTGQLITINNQNPAAARAKVQHTPK